MEQSYRVSKRRVAAATGAWLAILALCAFPYAVLAFASIAETEWPSGQSICPQELCWAEARSPLLSFLVGGVLSSAVTLLVCGSILNGGMRRPRRNLIAAFPLAHFAVVIVLLAWTLSRLA